MPGRILPGFFCCTPCMFDRNFLVIPWRFSGEVVIGRKQTARRFVRDAFCGPLPLPELIWRREIRAIRFFAGQKVMFNNPMPIRGVCKFQPKDLSVFFGLLQAIARLFCMPLLPQLQRWENPDDSAGDNRHAFEGGAWGASRRSRFVHR